MKKLALLAAFAGVLSVGAIAQDNQSDVTFTVGTYRQVNVDSDATLAINDGGFGGSYLLGNGTYSTWANAAWSVGVASSPVLFTPAAGNVGGGTWAVTPTGGTSGLAGATSGNNFGGTLARTGGAAGSHITNGTAVSFTLTLTIGP